MRGWRWVGIAGIGLFALATACGEAGDEALEPDRAAAPFEEAHERQRVVVRASSFAYQPSEFTVAPGPVTFVVTNAADVAHGLEVEGHGLEEAIETIPPGATDSLTVSFAETGEYVLYCPVGNHRERGMTGTVSVGE